MLKPIMLSLAVIVSGMTSPAFAEEANPTTAPAEAKFDPGVPAPKVANDYYNGAEKVVVHVSVDGDEKKYLGNVSNYIKALDATGKKTEAVIVMNGDGLGMLKLAKELEMNVDAKLPGKISELKEKGVKFDVCYNTLAGRKIKFDELYDAKPEDIIPSGVAEVGRLEAHDYRLLKP